MKVNKTLTERFVVLAKEFAKACKQGVVESHTVEAVSQPEVVKVYAQSATTQLNVSKTFKAKGDAETKKKYDWGKAPIHNTSLHWKHIRATKNHGTITLDTGRKLTYGALNYDIPYGLMNDNIRIRYPSAWQQAKHYHTIDNGEMVEVPVDRSKGAGRHRFHHYACRDYANADLKLRLHPELRQIEGGHALNRARLFADSNALAKLVENGVESNKLNMALRSYAPVRYIVFPYKRTSFFYDILQKMEQVMASEQTKEIQPFLISTISHAMTVTMKIKKEAGKPTEYSISMYDPNMTYNHLKLTVTDLAEVKELSFRDILREEPLAYTNPAHPWWTVVPVTQEIIDDVMEITKLSPDKQKKLAKQVEVIVYDK